MAQKSRTSSAVKNRWNTSHYQFYRVNLNLETDKELIDFVERYKAAHDGKGVSDIFRAGCAAMIKQEQEEQ